MRSAVASFVFEDVKLTAAGGNVIPQQIATRVQTGGYMTGNTCI